MTGSVWTTFLILLATMIIGYEIGATVTIRKVRYIMNQMAENMARKKAQNMARKKEGAHIESKQRSEDG